MKGSFFSMVVERKSAGWIGKNVVVFGPDAKILQVAPMLREAVDIIQSRFVDARFLLEISEHVSQEAVQGLPDAFEFDSAAGLWCISIEERGQLPEPLGYVSDFNSYAKMFRILSQEPGTTEAVPVDVAGSIAIADHRADKYEGDDSEVDLDGFWEHIYAHEGLVCFRLFLPI